MIQQYSKKKKKKEREFWKGKKKEVEMGGKVWVGSGLSNFPIMEITPENKIRIQIPIY